MVRNAVDSSANRYVQLACARVNHESCKQNPTLILFSSILSLSSSKSRCNCNSIEKTRTTMKKREERKTHLQLSHCRHQRYSFKTQFKSSDGDHKDINHQTSLLSPIVTVSNLFVARSSTIGLSC